MSNVLSMRRLATISAVTGLASSLAVGAAFGATARSNWGYFGPYAGYSYQNRAIVDNVIQLEAITKTETQNGSEVPTGYMGSLARLYISAGDTLCSQVGYGYNSGKATEIDQYDQNGCGHGFAYYSYGASAVWNGSGYNYFYTYKSPNINN